MNGERALELLKIERECVNRNNQPFGQNCSRECGKCDLLQNTEELIAMYDYVIREMAPKDKEIELNKAMGILQRECESHAHCIECPLGYESGSYIMCKLDRPPEFYEPLLKEQNTCSNGQPCTHPNCKRLRNNTLCK